jgi:hypothetical protein
MTAKRKTAAHSGGPHSATHTPPSQPPAPSAVPPAGSPAAAVWAALTANPGATAAQIAAAAGTSRTMVSRELARFEASGLATGTSGSGNGRGTAPATWQPVPATTVPSAGSGGAGPNETDLPAAAEEDGDPIVEMSPTDSGDAAATGTAADHDAVSPTPSDAPPEGAAPDTNSMPDATADDAGTQPAVNREPPPACGEVIELLNELASAAGRVAALLRGSEPGQALAGMDAICAAATQSRRLLKAAAAGRKARGAAAARPGQLRDLVQAHLAAHPDAEFTPHAIGRVLGRSSGAVANALDRLTALGQAQLTCERPRRYKAMTTATVSGC